ncbi:MAG: hypothetical protein ACREBB_05825 [Nitrosotalea sp.]
MDNRIIISISLLLILSISIPNSFASLENSTLDSQGNYANPSLGITFQAPEGWTVQEPNKSQSGAPEIAVIAPYSSGFTASISFNIENANGTSLDDYIKNKNNQLMANNQSGNITFLSKQNDTIDGFVAKISLLEENFTSQNGNNIIKFKQATILANDKFYMITYANDENNFDADLSNYDQLLDSIKFVSSDTSFLFDYVSIGIVVGALVVGVIIIIKRKKKLTKKT